MKSFSSYKFVFVVSLALCASISCAKKQATLQNVELSVIDGKGTIVQKETADLKTIPDISLSNGKSLQVRGFSCHLFSGLLVL